MRRVFSLAVVTKTDGFCGAVRSSLLIGHVGEIKRIAMLTNGGRDWRPPVCFIRSAGLRGIINVGRRRFRLLRSLRWEVLGWCLRVLTAGTQKKQTTQQERNYIIALHTAHPPSVKTVQTSFCIDTPFQFAFIMDKTSNMLI